MVSDAAGNTSVTTWDLTVLGVIAARMDEYELDEDLVLNIGAEVGVLNNDGDGSINGLTVTIVDQPEHGVVTLNADGSFTYTPDDDYFGEDTFTYRSTNGTDVSNVAAVKLMVNPKRTPPRGCRQLHHQ